MSKLDKYLELSAAVTGAYQGMQMGANPRRCMELIWIAHEALSKDISALDVPLPGERLIMKNKRCPGCETDKPLAAFSVARRRPDGLQPYCRDCMAERWRKYSEKNLERFAETYGEKGRP